MVNFYKIGEGQIVALEMPTNQMMRMGEGVEQLAANSTDAAQEKHVPVVSVEGGQVVVRIGSVPHPMLAEHYIEWVYVKTSFGGVHCDLQPGDEPVVRFKNIAPSEVEEVYIYCNLHGLWKAKEPVLAKEFSVNNIACSPEFTAGCVEHAKQ